MTDQTQGDKLLAKKRQRCVVVRAGILSFLFLASALLMACTSDVNDRARNVINLLIRGSDLPPGWTRGSGNIGRRDQYREGIISRSLSYHGVPPEQVVGVLVTHELVDYPSAAQATDAYPEIVATVIPTEAWTWPEQVDFPSKADQVRVACVRENAEITWCTSVAQYDNYISIIYANLFEDKWLTMDDFERLLESIDTRLAAATDEN